MKVIDLLNKIANREEIPGKIKYDRKIYHYGNYIKWYIADNLWEELFIDKNKLNDEIEIIEEEKKIPEKLNLKLDDWTTPTQCDIELSKKIDEIIDYLKSKGE